MADAAYCQEFVKHIEILHVFGDMFIHSFEALWYNIFSKCAQGVAGLSQAGFGIVWQCVGENRVNRIGPASCKFSVVS